MQWSFNRLFLRATWLKVHLYLALTSGLFIAILGLTGSLSVYQEAIDTAFNPQLVIDQPEQQGRYQSLDAMMAAVHAAHPQRLGSWTLELPSSPQGMATAWYEKPRETFFELYAPLMVSINPYTAEVVASRFWGHTFATTVLDTHTQLLMGRPGWLTVGFLGGLLLISVISGLYLWWPGLSALPTAFCLRVYAGWGRFALDVHRLLGLLSAVALLVLASTGIVLSFPSISESLFGAAGMAHGETGRPLASTAVPNNHPASLAAAAFVAQGPFPKAVLRRVTTPVGDAGIYRINLRQIGEINQRHPYTTVWVDRWSGQIREVRNPQRFSEGERISTWIWPLHTGEALGGMGRFLWFLAGQSLFWLYITGLLRWLTRKGLVQDRSIDVESVKPLASKIAKAVYSVGRFGALSTLKALKLGRPYLVAAHTKLMRYWHQQLQANRPKNKWFDDD